MSIDHSEKTERAEDRLQQLVAQTHGRLIEVEAEVAEQGIDSKTIIEFAIEDLLEGLSELQMALQILPPDNPVRHFIVSALIRMSEGFYSAGEVLSRNSIVALRFKSDADIIARKAKAVIDDANKQIVVDAIKGEIESLSYEERKLTASKLSDSIVDSVNLRLHKAGHPLTSKTTIYRRIIEFGLLN